DIARVGHWESVWRNTKTVHRFSRFNYFDFRLASLFRLYAGPGSRVLEVGCGGSRWIPFFDEVLRCETWGIDYSREGLRLVREDNPGRETQVRLIQGDFFDEDLLPSRYFDLLYSLGFVEHFQEVSVVTRRIAQLLSPGGRVMTLIPNFVSLYGGLQNAVNPEVFAKHVVMDGTTLDEHHVAAGLTPIMPAKYWGCFAPGVVNFGRAGRFLIPPIKVLQHFVCWTAHAIRCDFESRYFSPYVVGVYEKPRDPAARPIDRTMVSA